MEENTIMSLQQVNYLQLFKSNQTILQGTMMAARRKNLPSVGRSIMLACTVGEAI
jgi:hypothetical protein